MPFAFGTTGYLTRFEGATSWQDLFDPPARTRVGMLEEVREVVGAALIASGHGPNETSQPALAAARALLARQRPSVARYDSDDFITPVVSGEVGIHHAWSGPAVWGTRRQPRLRYVVPDEGAVIWITAAAIPAGAPDSVASTALLRELMDPELAALTTLTERLLHPERGGPPPAPGRSARRRGSVPDRGHARPVPSAPRPR